MPNKAPIVERAGDYVKRSVKGAVEGALWLTGGLVLAGSLLLVPIALAASVAAGVEATRLGVVGALA